MYELYPYFTNDGTVGLYSEQDDDIYHSTYGAVTESWEKFVVPAGLREYLSRNNEVKILDICYGIGYNTKTALKVFLEEVEKKENFFLKNKKNYKNSSKNFQTQNRNIAAIDTDNISSNNERTFCKKNSKNHDFNMHNTKYSESIDADNIPGDSSVQNPACGDKIQSKNISINDETHFVENKILIDAVDTDKILIGLSPFITNGVKNEFLLRKKIYKTNFNLDNPQDNNCKLHQIKKMQKSQITKKGMLKKEYRIENEISIIVLEKLLENKNMEQALSNDQNLQKLLNEKKYSSYFSKHMINLARFYSKKGSYYIKDKNKLTFLHNIYYQYISRSNKKAQKLQKMARVDLNFHPNDARSFIQSTLTKYDFIFLDAFTPAKCPALWTLEFFRELYSRLEDDGMILTYSNSAAIRSAFLKNGFFVGKIYNETAKKFTGTVSVKNEMLIKHNLSEQDLALIDSKAGICYRDENLDLNNDIITENRNIEISRSELCSSSKVLKSYRKGLKVK